MEISNNKVWMKYEKPETMDFVNVNYQNGIIMYVNCLNDSYLCLECVFKIYEHDVD